MDPYIQKVIAAAMRLDAALQQQTGPVSMAVRVAHRGLREVLLNGLEASVVIVDDPDTRHQLPCHICGKQKGQPPERCPGHYEGTSSALTPESRPQLPAVIDHGPLRKYCDCLRSSGGYIADGQAHCQRCSLPLRPSER